MKDHKQDYSIGLMLSQKMERKLPITQANYVSRKTTQEGTYGYSGPNLSGAPGPMGRFQVPGEAGLGN